MWYLSALASAFLYAFRGILEKKKITHTNKYILGLSVRLFAVPFFILPLIIHPDFLVPLSHLGGKFWFALFMICCVFTPLETVFYYESLKEEELSLALPILSMSPIVTIILAAMLLHELPTLLGVVGILIILSGVYALKISHAREGLLEPIKHLRRSRGVRLMFVVMLSQGAGSIFDKMALQSSNAFFYAAVNYVLVSLVLFIIAWIKAPKHFGELRQHASSFTAIGLVVAGYTIFYLLALQSGIASYVVAIRNASILFSILFGIVLLREKGKRAKLTAGALIFLGLLCIKVFS